LQGGTQIRGQISKPKESLGHERISTIVFLKLSKGLGLEQTREKEIQRFEVGLVGFPFCLVSALAVVGPHIYISTYIYIYIYIRYIHQEWDPGRSTCWVWLGIRTGEFVMHLFLLLLE
jgi:hypothetical protein